MATKSKDRKVIRVKHRYAAKKKLKPMGPESMPPELAESFKQVAANHWADIVRLRAVMKDAGVEVDEARSAVDQAVELINRLRGMVNSGTA